MTLQRHEPTIERMRENYSKRGLELNDARLRMATIPSPAQVSFFMANFLPHSCTDMVAHSLYSTREGFASMMCQVLFSGDLWVPLVVAQCGGASVYVLPGKALCHSIM